MSFDQLNLDDPLDPLPTGLNAAAASATPCKRTQQAFSLQWAAGFVDGEGCIYICKQTYTDPRRHDTYRLGFTITQNDLQVLEHFRHGMGIPGSLYRVRRQPGHSRQVFAIHCSGRSALRVITMLQPFLIRKWTEAQAAIDYWQQGFGGQHPGRGGWSPSVIATREYFFQTMKTLK